MRTWEKVVIGAGIVAGLLIGFFFGFLAPLLWWVLIR
jgi:hypothetical protein